MTHFNIISPSSVRSTLSNMMVGQKISERLHVGFGGAVKLGGNDPQYQYLLEARVGWLF